MKTFRFELGNETIELVARGFDSAWNKAYKYFKCLGFTCTYNADMYNSLLYVR